MLVDTVQSDSNESHGMEAEHLSASDEESGVTSAESEEEQELSGDDLTDEDAAHDSTADSALPASKRARTDPGVSVHAGVLNSPAFAPGPVPRVTLTAGANDAVGTVPGTFLRAGPVAPTRAESGFTARALMGPSASAVPVNPTVQHNPSGTPAAASARTLPLPRTVQGVTPRATSGFSLLAVSGDVARSRPMLAAFAGNQPTGRQAPLQLFQQWLQQQHSRAQQGSAAQQQRAVQHDANIAQQTIAWQQSTAQQQVHPNGPPQQAAAMQQSQQLLSVYAQELQRPVSEQPPQINSCQAQQYQSHAQQQQKHQAVQQLQQRQTASIQTPAEQWTRAVHATAEPLQPIQRQQRGQPLWQQLVQQAPQSLHAAGIGEPQVTGPSLWDGTHACQSMIALQQQQLLLREQHLKAELAQVQQQRMQLAIPTQLMPHATVPYQQQQQGQLHI